MYFQNEFLYQRILNFFGNFPFFLNCIFLGQWGAAVALLLLAYTTSTTTAVVTYTIGVTMFAFTFVGFQINVLDIAPNFAGLLMGLTNGIANVTAISGPAFVGFVVKPLVSKV